MRTAAVAILLLFVLAVGVFSSAFVVDEKEQVFITQFGKPIRGPITTPGLKFKLPLIQKVRSFDRRFLEWDGNPNQVPTKDKRYISIDTYARWRIKDPLIFFQNVTDETGAQSRLDDILDGATRSAVASHNLVEIVRSQTRPDPEPADPDLEELSFLPPFEVGRRAIAQNILTNAAVQLESWGIELLDIRFKRINYEEDVKRKIFDRMISERKRIADKYRSEGEGEAAKILGQSERDLKRVQSEAYRKAQEIQGQADAEAAAIYAAAFNESLSAREFYRFLKTMETYEASLSTQDLLLLSTKGDFYRYLSQAISGAPVPDESDRFRAGEDPAKEATPQSGEFETKGLHAIRDEGKVD